MGGICIGSGKRFSFGDVDPNRITEGLVRLAVNEGVKSERDLKSWNEKIYKVYVKI